MSKSFKLIIMFVSTVLLLAIGISLYQNFYERNEKANEIHTISDNELRDFQKPAAKEWEETITVGAIGDILIHDWVYEDAKDGITYDFKPMFSHVREELLKPDVLLANQETVLGGTSIGLSSYPRFNSPFELGEALIDSGVDIVSTANNHTLDRGETAIMNAIDFYERSGLFYVGHFKNEEDKQKLRIINNNGIKLAFLSYSYGTNGIPVPKGKDYLVNLFEDSDAMKEEIERAKEEADVVIMSIHWGNEYQRFPAEQQKLMAKDLSNYGVDIIFGHHPHVLQPMEWIEGENHRTFVVYSLGNFISAQIRNYKDIGGLATVQITKRISEEGTSIEIKEPDFFPTYVASQGGVRNFQVVPLRDAGNYGLQNVENVTDEIMNHMFQWIE